MDDKLMIILFVGLPILGLVIGYVIRFIIAKASANSSEQRAKLIVEDTKREAENIKKEYLLEAKSEILNEKNKAEDEVERI